MNDETSTILIDNALATGRVSALDPEERGLQELALALRDDAPAPGRDFRLRMDAKVAAGFPRRRRISLPPFLMQRPTMTALGAAASILVALVVSVSLMGKDGQSRQFGSAGSSGSAAGGAEVAPSAQEPAAAEAPSASSKRAATPDQLSASTDSAGSGVVPPVAPVPPGDNFVGGGNRKVQRSAELQLTVPERKLNQVGDQVIAVTDRYRGFVLRSSITTAAEGPAGGSFDLRIPVRNLGAALRDMSALADVKSRTENADDVTASFVSARTRLEELMAERRGLLRRLEKAVTDQQAAAIRARIRLVNAQIEGAQTSLKELRRRTAYASVSVGLEATAGSSGGGGLGDGARDLRDSLIDSANIALRVLGFAIPIGLVAGLLLALNAWTTRRRREAVLEP